MQGKKDVFWVRKGMKNEDAFLLREMRVILSKLELLMKDKFTFCSQVG